VRTHLPGPAVQLERNHTAFRGAECPWGLGRISTGAIDLDLIDVPRHSSEHMLDSRIDLQVHPAAATLHLLATEGAGPGAKDVPIALVLARVPLVLHVHVCLRFPVVAHLRAHVRVELEDRSIAPVAVAAPRRCADAFRIVGYVFQFQLHHQLRQSRNQMHSATLGESS
jgi:hypothetical protein